MYARVIISLTTKDIDRPFDYAVPGELKEKIMLGMRVIVPFGAGGKKYEGYVTGFSDESDCPPDKIKDIISLPDDRPVFSTELLALAEWMRGKYYTTMAACLKCIMPSGISVKSDFLVELIANQTARVGKKQQEIINYLIKNDNSALKSEIANTVDGDIFSSLNSLEKKNIVKISELSKTKNLTLKVKYAYLNTEYDPDEPLSPKKEDNSPQERVLRLLSGSDGMAVSEIKNYLGITNSPIKHLEKNNLIYIEDVEIRRNIVYEYSQDGILPELTTEQAEAVSFLLERMSEPQLKPALLHGVTGSGKTEVYMRLIEHVIKNGKSAIMLVPEISLTPQTVETFIRRFGERVTVTHSRLTLAERYDQWKKARDSQVSVIIGPRSAVFAPFNNLGIIIIDEEHENTYKSEVTPKYSTKDVAIERGRISGAFVVLGSATPSVDSYFDALRGQMHLYALTERVNRQPPEINIVDMRLELSQGNRSVFSEALMTAVQENILHGRQTILFLNRRGHSTFVSCRRCGYVIQCDNCNVNYTYHMHMDKLICHYCGKNLKTPKNCPICASQYIKFFGIGTQKLEEETKKYFPGAAVLRMDLDTTSGKNAHERILTQFKNGEAQILIGTQMIAKGLDFPKVTLVGVIAADLSLNNGDYRAAENTYQLLTQVSGRAGRAKEPGRVFIQTYNPEHYSIIYARDNDYSRFYEHEIILRRQMAYPPYSHVFTILFTGPDEKKIIQTLYKLLDLMTHYNKKEQFEMLGPAPAMISKIKKQYRWKLIVKCAEEERLKNFVIYCLDKLKVREDTDGITVNITLDPAVIV